MQAAHKKKAGAEARRGSSTMRACPKPSPTIHKSQPAGATVMRLQCVACLSRRARQLALLLTQKISEAALVHSSESSMSTESSRAKRSVHLGLEPGLA